MLRRASGKGLPRTPVDEGVFGVVLALLLGDAPQGLRGPHPAAPRPLPARPRAGAPPPPGRRAAGPPAPSRGCAVASAPRPPRPAAAPRRGSQPPGGPL